MIADEETGTQPEVDTAAEELTPPAPTGTETETEPAATPETPAAPAPAAEDEPKTPAWVQARIDKLTREKWEARRDADAARQLADRLQAQGASAPAEPAAQDIERLVQQRAVELRDIETFNAGCNATYAKGKSEIPDFDSAVQGYSLLGGAPRPFLEAVTELPNGPQVYYALSKDLDEAQRVLSLPPVRMAVELTRISQKLAAKPAVSSAPAPIKPIGGSGASDAEPEDMAEWIKWRERQVKALRS